MPRPRWVGLERHPGVAPSWACAPTCPGPFLVDWVSLGGLEEPAEGLGEGSDGEWAPQDRGGRGTRLGAEGPEAGQARTWTLSLRGPARP